MRIQASLLGLLLCCLAPTTLSLWIPRQSSDTCILYAENGDYQWGDRVTLSPSGMPSTHKVVDWTADDTLDNTHYAWTMHLNNDAVLPLRLENTMDQGGKGQQFLFLITFYNQDAKKFWLDSAKSCMAQVDFITADIQSVYVFRRTAYL